MRKTSMSIGDTVITEFGIGKIISIGKKGDYFFVRIVDGREIYMRLEHIKDIFEKHEP